MTDVFDEDVVTLNRKLTSEVSERSAYAIGSSTEIVISGLGWVRAQVGAAGPSLPFEAFSIEAEVPNKADQRAMGKSMMAATFAAGRAIGAAGLKGRSDLLAQTQILIAGRCVERDEDLDNQVLAAFPGKAIDSPGANLAMLQGLRPSMFLSQLPNLISANISIVHGVIGRSQTFFGEEVAGIEALCTAMDRIWAGEADLCLTGGVFSAESQTACEAATAVPPLRQVYPLGSSAAFAVLESRRRADERGHQPTGRIAGYLRTARNDLDERFRQASARVDWNNAALVLASRGTDPLVGREQAFLAGLMAEQPGLSAPVVLGQVYGASFEALASTALAVAADLLSGSSSSSVQWAVAVIFADGCDAVFVLEGQ